MLDAMRTGQALLALSLLAGCGAAPAPDLEALRVMTVNLRHDEDLWQRRFELIADEIARLEPDLIGLQEVEITVIEQSRVLGELLAERLGGQSPYAFYEHLKPGLMGLSGEGIAIFSRFPIEQSEFVDIGEGRLTLFVQITTPGGITADLFNTHLHNADGEDDARLAQAEQTLDFMAERGAGDAVFLTGDMNSEPDSDAIERLVASGLIDTYAHVHGAETARTGNTSPIALAEGTFDQHPDCRIDYVLAKFSSAIAAHARVSDSIVCFQNHDQTGLYPSDHLGVMSTFQLPVD
ncbi:MAG: endonuclease/exonuclease/phosphatase family protein [Deltaproteobacteria bacterium]|nr:endonuclease/exonuclease/phosphatase family protein [Deltaproteobacteria bacterium]